MSSPPLSLSDTITGSHRFTVNGFSLSKGIGSGKRISSDTFTAGGYEWAIYFYPEGTIRGNPTIYVSVHVALVSEGTNVMALFEISLLDQSGKGKHHVVSNFDRDTPLALKKRGSTWGFHRYFKRDMLEISDYLKDDRLKFNCTVGVVVDDSKDS